MGDPKLFAQQRTMAEKNVKVGRVSSDGEAWRDGLHGASVCMPRLDIRACTLSKVSTAPHSRPFLEEWLAQAESVAAPCALTCPQEVLAAAEAAAAAARAAVASYRERLPVLLRLPSFLPPPPEYLAALEGRAAEAEQLLASVTAGTYVPPTPPAAAEAAAPAPAPAAAPAVAPAVAQAGASGAPLASAAGDLASLEARLAALEEENSKKDAQVGALAVDELILVHDHAAC